MKLIQPGTKKIKEPKRSSINPLVSIITPFYNAGEFFEETYVSVINQTFDDFEWLIINDGSDDDSSLVLLENLASNDTRIRTINKINGGIASAQNVGIMEAKTEYILPLDADDLLEPEYIEKLYVLMEQHPECSWGYTDCIGFYKQEYLWSKPFNAALMREVNWLTKTALIRKKELIRAGLYCEESKYINEDWHMWLKMLSLSMRPLRLVWFGFWYRRRDNGIKNIIDDNLILRSTSLSIIRDIADSVDNNVRAITIGDGRISVKYLIVHFLSRYHWGRAFIRFLINLRFNVK